MVPYKNKRKITHNQYYKTIEVLQSAQFLNPFYKTMCISPDMLPNGLWYTLMLFDRMTEIIMTSVDYDALKPNTE